VVLGLLGEIGRRERKTHFQQRKRGGENSTTQHQRRGRGKPYPLFQGEGISFSNNIGERKTRLYLRIARKKRTIASIRKARKKGEDRRSSIVIRCPLWKGTGIVVSVRTSDVKKNERPLRQGGEERERGL